MIDLHTHTNESDGTYSPFELVDAASSIGLTALAITDHDTFAGYEQAVPRAAQIGLALVRGIELNSRMEMASGGSKAVHLLAYFAQRTPSEIFMAWLNELQEERRDRNLRLVERLQSLGIEITLDEVVAEGRSLAGRPHFARILVRKGHADSSEQAFRKYLGETAQAYVERNSPSVAETIEKVRLGGGVPVLAHPIRLGFRDRSDEEAAIARMRDKGLLGIEAYHSDHTAGDVQRYLGLAEKYELRVTGGSDFHGGNKPQIELGTGRAGNVRVPDELLDGLRELAG